MTLIRSKPASSALDAMSASTAPSRGAPSGHVKLEMCRPSFTATSFHDVMWIAAGDPKKTLSPVRVRRGADRPYRTHIISYAR